MRIDPLPKIFHCAKVAILSGLVLLSVVAFSQAEQGKKLLNLSSGTHAPGGNEPWSGVIRDAAGNLYGTTSAGGAGSGGFCSDFGGCGTVFELLRNGDGTWTHKVLHNFDGNDGATPAANLAFDSRGRLFGTTLQGGSSNNCGTVFELSRQGSNWKFTKVYTFCSLANGEDGMFPRSQLIFDRSGNIFGTASEGGSGDRGVAFELSPKSGGGWTYTILHTFLASIDDGTYPEGGLAFDAFGNLWGATETGGGFANAGTVYEFTPNSSGGWNYQIVYVFQDFPRTMCAAPYRH